LTASAASQLEFWFTACGEIPDVGATGTMLGGVGENADIISECNGVNVIKELLNVRFNFATVSVLSSHPNIVILS